MYRFISLLLIAISLSVSAQWFTGTDDDGATVAETFYDRLKFLETITIGAGDFNPVAAFTEAASGSLFLSRESEIYLKQDDGQSERWYKVGAEFKGVKNLYKNGNADYGEVSDFNTGNNATFDGGGSLAGTWATASTPVTDAIDGTRFYRFTQAAGSLNDYIASETIDVPLGYRGETHTVEYFYKYDGNAGDIEFEAKCMSPAALITGVSNTSLSEQDNANNTAKKQRHTFRIPQDCTSIRMGWSVAVLNNTAEFVVDEITITPSPEASFGGPTDTQTVMLDGDNGAGSSGTHIARWTTLVSELGNSNNIFTYTDDATNGASFTANVDGVMTLSWSKCTNVEYYFGFSKNASGLTTDVDALAADERLFICEGNTSDPNPCTWSGDVSSGDIIRAHYGLAFASTTGCNQITVTMTSTRNAAQTGNANIENTYTARISSGVGPTITSSSAGGAFLGGTPVTRTGAGDYTINFATSFFSVAPSAEITLESTSAQGNAQIHTVSATSVRVLTYDTTDTLADIDFTVRLHRQDADYRDPKRSFVVDPFDSCVLSEEQTSGTAGGTFTSGSYQTRTLNTTSGSCNFVTLTSNQFTLTAGQYELEADAPAFKVDEHKIKIRNITAASDTAIGTSESTASTDDVVTRSFLSAAFTLTSSATFELQHRGSTTRATDGFGLANTFGDDEVYSKIRVRRLNSL